MNIDWDAVIRFLTALLAFFATAIGLFNWRQLRANASKTESEAAKTSADAQLVRANVAQTLEELSAKALARLSAQLQSANVELERLRGELADMGVELDDLKQQYSTVVAQRDNAINVARALATQLRANGIAPIHEVK